MDFPSVSDILIKARKDFFSLKQIMFFATEKKIMLKFFLQDDDLSLEKHQEHTNVETLRIFCN